MRRIIYTLLSLYLVTTAFAQEKLTHEKRVYKSPEGKLFINKDLPIYLSLSTSPDENAKSYLLESEETEAYSNPMYLDTEGYNTFRAPSAVDTSTKKPVYPLQDIIFEIYADSKAPSTKIDYVDVKPYTKEENLYLKGPLHIILKSTDQISGVENIYYSIDGKPYTTYSDTLMLTDSKEYIIKYYAADNVGNAEDVHERIIVLDDRKPKTSLKIEGDKHENVISARSEIALVSSDDKSGVSNTYYIVDNQNVKTYQYPFKGTWFSQGEHVIQYFSKDKVGNVEDTTTFTFYVDKTPPSVVEEVVGKTFIAGGQEFTSGRSKLKLTSFDNKAGVKEVYYSINDGEYKLYEKPFYLTIRSGNLQIKTYAVDNVNNKVKSVETSSRVSIPYIDLSGPSLDKLFSGAKFFARDTIYITPETKVILKGNDKEAGVKKIEYQVDDKGFVEYDKPFTVNEKGYHKITYTGVDNVDNTNQNEFFFLVDDQGPAIYEKFSVSPSDVPDEESENDKLETYPAHLVLFLSAVDKHAGYEKMFYSLNGGAEKLYTGLISGFKSGQKYVVKVRAQDKVGNETKTSFAFKIR